MKVRINKRYVLVTIGTKYKELGDWKYFNILVFKSKNSHEAYSPSSYEELVSLLEEYESVYAFNEVESLRHGEIAYDIIIEE